MGLGPRSALILQAYASTRTVRVVRCRLESRNVRVGLVVCVQVKPDVELILPSLDHLHLLDSVETRK